MGSSRLPVGVFIISGKRLLGTAQSQNGIRRLSAAVWKVSEL